ncbi:MAG: gliding motility-associated C-terminal domain-containing protein [Flectobacillus sp.]|uniref:T9SS type B sorting domain-containing protein n=1 Tax=Flectobacillus sp. TaxID=50419 RepID=UPI003B9A50AE
MNKFSLSLCFLLCFHSRVFSQTDCTNIGFELGSISGWTLSNGTLTDDGTKAVYGTETSGANYKIVNIGEGYDANITQDKIPVVSGSNYAIRLGSNTEGGSYHRLKTSFMVTADNALFQYKFAVMLANDKQGHADFQKPGFNIQITDQNGNQLACSYYDVQLSTTGSTATFKSQTYTNGTIEYKDWTTGAINLTKYIGQRINIQVTAHGCTRKTHFGYAYFDAQCLKAEIKANAVCPDENGFMTFSAPEGFAQYTWNTGATTSSITVKPTLGDKFWVKLLPLASLDASCELQLQYQLSYQHVFNSIDSTICEGESVAIDNKTYKSTGVYTINISRQGICDSTITLKLKVKALTRYSNVVSLCSGKTLHVGSKTYNSTGIYVDTLQRAGQCDSIVTNYLTIVEVDISVEQSDFNLVTGDKAFLKTIAHSIGNYQYTWVPSTDLSCATCSETWVTPNQSRQYKIFIISKENTACQDTETVNISVRRCDIVLLPDAFSPNQDNYNDYYFANTSGCVKQIKSMKIYNRWGELIFWKENLSPTDPTSGWDGTYRGVLAEVGSYAYQLEVELDNGHINHQSGAFVLIR